MKTVSFTENYSTMKEIPLGATRTPSSSQGELPSMQGTLTITQDTFPSKPHKHKFGPYMVGY